MTYAFQSRAEPETVLTKRRLDERLTAAEARAAAAELLDAAYAAEQAAARRLRQEREAAEIKPGFLYRDQDGRPYLAFDDALCGVALWNLDPSNRHGDGASKALPTGAHHRATRFSPLLSVAGQHLKSDGTTVRPGATA